MKRHRSKALEPWEEDRMLRRAERADATMVRLECLRATLPLLRLAGFLNPQPFHRYLVPFEWAEGGMMRVKRGKCRLSGDR